MSNKASNVLVARPLATGGILSGPTGTALPTDVATAPAAAFLPYGYVGDSGVTQMIGTNVQNISAWGGDIVRKVQTEHDLTYKFMLIETNNGSLGLYYGSGNVATVVTPTPVTTVAINGTELTSASYVIEVQDGARRVRIVIPVGQVTDRSDVVYVHTDAVMYEVTITCYPDNSGQKAYLYCTPAAA